MERLRENPLLSGILLGIGAGIAVGLLCCSSACSAARWTSRSLALPETA